MKKRFLKYLFLSALIILIPYLTMIILILVTGDRIEGMKLGVIPGLILPHLIFGLWVIQRQLATKTLLTMLVATAIYALLIITIAPGIGFLTGTDRNGLRYTNFDAYGFRDLVLVNLVYGLIVWEVFYHINKLTTKAQSNMK